jgi:hypothetical protein
MALKYKISDAGNLNMSICHKVLLSGEKMNDLNLIRKEKNSILRLR